MKKLLVVIIAISLLLYSCGTTASLEKRNMKQVVTVNGTDTLVTYVPDEELMMKDVVNNTAVTAVYTGILAALFIMGTLLGIVAVTNSK